MGKVDQARALAEDCLKSAALEPSDRFELVVDGTLLAHFEPQSPPTSFLETLKADSSQKTSELRLSARVNGCEPVAAADLEGLEDQELKARFELELLVRSDPKAALARVLNGSDAPPGITAAAWGLLLAEAARIDEHHAALPRLLRWAPTGNPGAFALIQYALHGTSSDELEDLPAELLAAADFVHSRAVPAGSAESQALRARAQREDQLHGPVSVAMRTWSL